MRVIVDGNGGVLERNDYYPFGVRHVRGDHPQLAVNRFKYTGKELQVTGNLGYLDHGARMYDSGLGRWFGMDLMAEDYYSWSVYNYCLNQPVRFIDPNGMWVEHWLINPDGSISLVPDTRDKRDELFAVDEDGDRTGASMYINDRDIISQLMKSKKVSNLGVYGGTSLLSFAVGKESRQNEMLRLFFFAANNTGVEWRIDRYRVDNTTKYTLGTLHDPGFSPAAEHMGFSTKSSVAFIHSHPNVKSTFNKEFESMGWDMKEGMAIRVSDAGYKMLSTAYDNTLYYTYFPKSRRLWLVEKYYKPSFIKDDISSYRSFLFGTINTK